MFSLAYDSLFMTIIPIIQTLFLDGIEPSLESTADSILTSNILYISSAVHRATLIAQSLGLKREQPIYILIHNIDGIELRNKEFQRVLATLVCDSYVVNESDVDKDQMKQRNNHVVRLAATIDNVDSPMFLWDIHMLQKFSWVSIMMYGFVLFFHAFNYKLNVTLFQHDLY